MPSDPAARDERCREAYNIQVQGLASRLASTRITKAVIGVSGGLDSAQALIVTTRAVDRLGLPRSNVLAFSMPGFATSERTRTNALALMRALGVTAREIDIRPSCLQMLKDLGHPFASGQMLYDVTFENVQGADGQVQPGERSGRRTLCAPGFLPLLHQPLRLSPQSRGLSCRACVGKRPVGCMAGGRRNR